MDDLFGMDDSSTDSLLKDDHISFNAIFVKAWTGVDKSWNITLSLAEHDSHQILKLAQLKDRVLSVGIVPVLQDG